MERVNFLRVFLDVWLKLLAVVALFLFSGFSIEDRVTSVIA